MAAKTRAETVCPGCNTVNSQQWNGWWKNTTPSYRCSFCGYTVRGREAIKAMTRAVKVQKEK